VSNTPRVMVDGRSTPISELIYKRLIYQALEGQSWTHVHNDPKRLRDTFGDRVLPDRHNKIDGKNYDPNPNGPKPTTGSYDGRHLAGARRWLGGHSSR